MYKLIQILIFYQKIIFTLHDNKSFFSVFWTFLHFESFIFDSEIDCNTFFKKIVSFTNKTLVFLFYLLKQGADERLSLQLQCYRKKWKISQDIVMIKEKK